jgi:hypothetical protein
MSAAERLRSQADLFLRLAKRGLPKLLTRVLPAAGERDLAGVAAEVRVALGEYGDEVAVVPIDRNQNRRLDTTSGLELDRFLRPQQMLAEAARKLGDAHRQEYICVRWKHS